MAWVTADEILVGAGATLPASTEDAEWAAACAAAIESGFTKRLEGIDPLTVADNGELIVAARLAGVDVYKRREAPFGVTGYVDLQGAAIRLARDYLEGIAPMLNRYATFGIG